MVRGELMKNNVEEAVGIKVTAREKGSRSLPDEVAGLGHTLTVTGLPLCSLLQSMQPGGLFAYRLCGVSQHRHVLNDKK